MAVRAEAAGDSLSMRRETPWTGLTVVALGAFVVWLSIQMSRTDRANEIVLTIAVSFGLIGIALALSMVGRRRRQ